MARSVGPVEAAVRVPLDPFLRSAMGGKLTSLVFLISIRNPLTMQSVQPGMLSYPSALASILKDPVGKPFMTYLPSSKVLVVHLFPVSSFIAVTTALGMGFLSSTS